MSEFEETESPNDEPDDGDRPITIPQRDLKLLRERGRKLSEAEQRAEAAERRLAFVEAGVPSEHPMTKYFVSGYQGDLTAEAIRSAATEAGLLATLETDEKFEAELDAHERTSSVTSGGSSVPVNAEAERDAKLRTATTPEQFDAVFAEYGGVMAEG